MKRRRALPAAVLLLAAAGCSSPTAPQTVDQFPDGPKIQCPAAPAPVPSPTGAPVSVQYGTAIASGGAPTVSITCTPPSGASFPLGTTTVTCTALDSRQRSSSCTFGVEVQSSPKLSATRFVAFGDSITAGEDGRSISITPGGYAGAIHPTVLLPATQTYPGVLLGRLQSRYIGQVFTVQNAGMPGEKAGASDTLTRFSGTLAGRAFDVVLLMEGSNDLANRDLRDIPPAIANLRTMIQDARSRGMRLFLANVPPMVPGGQRALAWSLVPTLNDQIRALASSEGLTLVDVNTALASNTAQYIGPDGLHPTPDGYAKIADTFFTTLRSALETSTTSAATSAPATKRFRR